MKEPKSIAPVKLAPSIWAADFTRLREQVREAEQCGADRIHLDVTDADFFGMLVVRALRRMTRLPLEVHLAIYNPMRFLEEYCDEGADSFFVHWEGNPDLPDIVRRIKALGRRAGVAIDPATPAAVLEEILPEADQALVRTVDPDLGGLQFLQSTLGKVRQLRRMMEQLHPECDLVVDGGIDPNTAPAAVAAGANVLVAGAAIFGSRNGIAASMAHLQTAANRAAFRSGPDRRHAPLGRELARF